MNKPVLSLDVSKRSSYAATCLSLHEPFKKPVSVPHTPEGLALLPDRLRNMEYLTGGLGDEFNQTLKFLV